MTKKRIGFFVDHGVEVRHYLLSGLYQQLKPYADCVFIIRDEIQSTGLTHYQKRFDLELISVNFVENKLLAHRLESYIRAIRDAAKRLKNIGNFHNFHDEPTSKIFKDLMLGNRLTVIIADWLGRKVLSKYYLKQYPETCDTLQKLSLTDIVMVDYNILHQLIGFSCKRLNIRTHVIMNTLKTMYINDYIPFKPSNVFIWNDLQVDWFKKANPGINSTVFKVTGNPFYQFFLSSEQSEITKCRVKYNLPEERPMVLYSLVAESIFAEEVPVVKAIWAYLQENFKDSEIPVMVIRRNPFEENSAFLEDLKGLNNLVIADHTWERKASIDWSIQHLQGEIEWKCLLQMANVAISVPSMANIESLLSGTPIIGIGFGADGKETVKLNRFAKAPFLKSIIQNKWSEVVLSLDDFKESFSRMMALSSPKTADIDKNLAGEFQNVDIPTIAQSILSKS